jgi:hypothetical protein
VSEYQHIEFRAVDRPLTDVELAYARKQSTRAEISRWSFQNYYTFGDFHGDVKGLLQRGYDVHLHYSNFGIRTVAMRMPNGLPFAKNVWSQYLGKGQLVWTPDRRGKGGVLTLDPYHEPGELDELCEFEQYMHSIVEVRSRILSGDLRVLYLLWLVSVIDDQEDLLDTEEPPLPAGLAEIANVFQLFLEFFGLDPLLLSAAAEGSSDAPKRASQEDTVQQWVTSQDEAAVKSLLHAFLTKDPAAVKAETMAKVLGVKSNSGWPAVTMGRTCQELLDRAVQLRKAQNEKERKKRAAAKKRKAAKQARERQERMKLMVGDPQKWLRKVDRLVSARGTDNYEAAAEILDELRVALADKDGKRITHKHAAHLAQKHPTLNRMKSSLRKRGLLE